MYIAIELRIPRAPRELVTWDEVKGETDIKGIERKVVHCKQPEDSHASNANVFTPACSNFLPPSSRAAPFLGVGDTKEC